MKSERAAHHLMKWTRGGDDDPAGIRESRATIVVVVMMTQSILLARRRLFLRIHHLVSRVFGMSVPWHLAQSSSRRKSNAAALRSYRNLIKRSSCPNSILVCLFRPLVVVCCCHFPLIDRK